MPWVTSAFIHRTTGPEIFEYCKTLAKHFNLYERATFQTKVTAMEWSEEKARWIVRKLHEQQERQRRLAQARVDWRDGASVPFLGEPVIVVLDPRHAFS